MKPLRDTRGFTLSLLAAAVVLSGCEQPTTPIEEAEPDSRTLVSDPLDITAWPASEREGTRRPARLALALADADRMLQLMDDAHDGGTSGFYLRELDGSVLLAENEDFVFEPASTIKALVHFHAMRQVQDGALIDGDVVSLARQVPNAWATPPSSSCPQPATPFSATLQTGLTAMMVPSDNPWTQALRDYFGDTVIDATRQTFDMDDSVLQHRIGCGADALANPNQLTLVDAGKMYESVATGFLTGPTLDAARAIMLTDGGLFTTMIDEEAADLGLSTDAVDDFKALRRSALKAGSYGLNTLEYRSVAGWAELGFKDASCAPAPREYVYGAFIHAADAVAGLGIRALGVETFREQVREGLETWAACEADLRVSSAQVIDLGAPLHVNDTITFTIRQNVRNFGPAEFVDATLVTSISAPEDCTLMPAADTTVIPGLGDEEVVLDLEASLVCTDPSHHLVRIDGEIQPVNAAIVDPEPVNDTRTTLQPREFIAYADLAATDWDFAELDGAGLGDFVMGETFTFATTKTVHNFGDTQLELYHDPADVRISRTLVVPAGLRGVVRIGADEAPAHILVERQGEPDQVYAGLGAGSTVTADGAATITVTFHPAALAVHETRQLVEEFGVGCLVAGEHDLLFTNEIHGVDPHLLDHVPGNNVIESARTIECVVPVAVNIRPGNPHNAVSPASHQQVPVAVLTTDAGEYDLPVAFDAATVNPATAHFGTLTVLGGGGGSTASHDFIRDSFELDDHTKDGDRDMVLHFPVVGTGADAQQTELCVTGSFLGDSGVWYTFLGCDEVSP